MSKAKKVSEINFEKLTKELYDAEEKEEKYWRENDAKFRAVYQKVATYDEFRNIVQASHLKSLDKGDKINGKFNQPWNIFATKHSMPGDEMPTSRSNEPINNLKHIKDFKKFWNSLENSSSKYNFLVNCEIVNLNKIFNFDPNCDLVGDMFVVLNEHYSEDKKSIIHNILSTLTKIKRFNLLIEFFTPHEKNSMNELIINLKKFLDQNNATMLENTSLS